MVQPELNFGSARKTDDVALQTLSAEVLAKMHAPSQEACGVPILKDPSQLEAYDAFLFGIPTRLGNFPAQWRTFWDLTGKQWFASAFWVCYTSCPHLIARLLTMSPLNRASTLASSSRPAVKVVDRRVPRWRL